MNGLKKNQIGILIAVIVVALGLVVYFVWLRPVTTPNVSVTEVTTSNIAQETFLALAAQLGPVAFDTSIFSNARFQALVDLKTPILPEPEGRNDPFGVIGRD